MFLLAIICPPLAVLLTGRPVQAWLNLGLTCCFYVPGMLHALSIVEEDRTQQRNRQMRFQPYPPYPPYPPYLPVPAPQPNPLLVERQRLLDESQYLDGELRRLWYVANDWNRGEQERAVADQLYTTAYHRMAWIQSELQQVQRALAYAGWR